MNTINGLTPDREEAVRLRKTGISVSEVARMLGRSRDFVQAAEKAQKNPEYRKRGPMKKNATASGVAANDAGGKQSGYHVDMIHVGIHVGINPCWHQLA
jgi:hypothetical protein